MTLLLFLTVLGEEPYYNRRSARGFADIMLFLDAAPPEIFLFLCVSFSSMLKRFISTVYKTSRLLFFLLF